MEVSSAPRRVDSAELGELFRRPELEELGRLAVAPLPSGHGVRGWLVVGKPMSGERGLTDERLRLLEGLSYRVAMALEKGGLAGHREQSLHVANALLMFARSLARAEKGDVEECIVRLAAEMLEAREVSLWLQAAPGADVAAVAAWDNDDEHRALVLADHLRSRGRTAVLGAARAILPPTRGVHPRSRRCGARPRGDVAVAPFALARVGWAFGRGSDVGETFGEFQLKMLAGLADQAKLAVSRRARAQQRHDVRAELVEEAPLVLARRVEDEVREAQVHVGADLLPRTARDRRRR